MTTDTETWTQIKRRHELEKIRAIHALMGGTVPEAAAALDMEISTLYSHLMVRGLRWNRAVVEAAYPELKSDEGA